MTVVVGWNSGSEVYLCADAVITSNHSLSVAESSLGELQIDQWGRTSQEGALKTRRYDNAGLGISSNDYKAAAELGRNIEHFLTAGADPAQAFRQAIIASTAPGMVSPHSLAFGCFRQNAPVLLVFNQDDTGQVHEVADFVSLGSVRFPRAPYQKFLQQTSAKQDEPEVRLISLMAALQQFTIRNNWMDRGVGGTYSGLTITNEGTKYQPDILYLIQPFHSERNAQNSFMVTARVREDFMFVESPKINGTHVFGYYRFSEERENALARVVRAASSVQSLDRIIVDYAMIIATDVPKVIIVKMDRAAANQHLVLDDLSSGFGAIHCGPELSEEISKPPTGKGNTIQIHYLASDD